MLMDLVRRIVRALAPTWVADRARRYLLIRRAQRLQRACRSFSDVDEILNAAFAFGTFEPNQIRSEVRRLLQIVGPLKARRILEIGSQGGGTLFLFSKVAAPDAGILSIDLNYSTSQMAAYPFLADPGQRLTCVKADSHDSATLKRVREWLGSDQLDVLFIDGDHSLAGVAADHEMYAPLVRAGGVIAFHDIVQDHRTRYGRMTIANAGEVPVFWAQVKLEYPEYAEFVDDPGQDGAGIGVVRGRGRP